MFSRLRVVLARSKPSPPDLPASRFETVAAALTAGLAQSSPTSQVSPAWPATPRLLAALCFLVDWRLVLCGHEPYTGLEWRHDGTLPFNEAAADILRASPLLGTGDRGGLVLAPGVRNPVSSLPGEVQDAVRHVLAAAARRKGRLNVVRLIHSTYPVLNNPRLTPLDLVGDAEAYWRSDRGRADLAGKTGVA